MIVEIIQWWIWGLFVFISFLKCWCWIRCNLIIKDCLLLKCLLLVRKVVILLIVYVSLSIFTRHIFHFKFIVNLIILWLYLLSHITLHLLIKWVTYQCLHRWNHWRHLDWELQEDIDRWRGKSLLLN